MASDLRLKLIITAENGELKATLANSKNEVKGLGTATTAASGKMTAGFKRAEGEAKALGAGLMDLRRLVLEAFAVREIYEFGQSFVEAKVAAQKIHYALVSAFGSAKQANQEFSFLARTSQKLGLDLRASGFGFARLAASAKMAGVSTKELQSTYIGLADAATVLHMSGEEFNGILTQLDQGMSFGKIQMQDLRAISQHLPATFDLASKAVKLMGGNLQEMLAKGGIPAKQFFIEFGAVLREHFGAPAEEASHSLNATINRLHNAFFNLQRGAAGGGFLSGLKDAIQAITAMLQDPVVTSTLGAITSALAHILDLVVHLSGAIAIAVATVGARLAVGGIGRLAASLGTLSGASARVTAARLEEAEAGYTTAAAARQSARAELRAAQADTLGAGAAERLAAAELNVSVAERGRRDALLTLNGARAAATGSMTARIATLYRMRGAVGLLGRAFSVFGGLATAAFLGWEIGKRIGQLQSVKNLVDGINQALNAEVRIGANPANTTTDRIAQLKRLIALQQRIIHERSPGDNPAFRARFPGLAAARSQSPELASARARLGNLQTALANLQARGAVAIIPGSPMAALVASVQGAIASGEAAVAKNSTKMEQQAVTALIAVQGKVKEFHDSLVISGKDRELFPNLSLLSSRVKAALADVQATIKQTAAQGSNSAAALVTIKYEMSQRKAALDRELAAEQISYQDYYAALAAMQAKEIRAEIAGARAKLPSIAVDKRHVALAQIAVLERQLAALGPAAAQKTAAANQKLSDQLDQVHQKLLAITDPLAAQIAQIKAKYAKLIADLKANGLANQIPIVLKLETKLEGQVKASALGSQVQRIVTSFRRRQQALGTQVQIGAISQIGAQSTLQGWMQQAETKLDAIIQKAHELGGALGTQLAAQAERGKVAIRQLGTPINQLAIAIKGELVTGISQFFDAIITGSKSAGAAFRDMIVSMLEWLAKYIIEQEIAKAVSYFFGGGSVGKAAGGPVGKAAGGPIHGPGTETSDSIPAMLSRGEFVVRASAVRKVGVKTLEAINGGKVARAATNALANLRGEGVARYAFGGLVTPAAVAASGAGASMPARGGASVSVSAPISVQVQAGEGTDENEARAQGKALGAVIKMAVQREMINQQRPGGIIYGTAPA